MSVEKNVIDFLQGKIFSRGRVDDWQAGHWRDVSDGKIYYLHGNAIAWHTLGKIYISTKWNTPTTKRRLDFLIEHTFKGFVNTTFGSPGELSVPFLSSNRGFYCVFGMPLYGSKCINIETPKDLYQDYHEKGREVIDLIRTSRLTLKAYCGGNWTFDRKHASILKLRGDIDPLLAYLKMLYDVHSDPTNSEEFTLSNGAFVAPIMYYRKGNRKRWNIVIRPDRLRKEDFLMKELLKTVLP